MANNHIVAPGVIEKPQKAYIGADEVRELLGIGRSSAYKIIKQTRKELVDSGKLPDDYPSGKVPRRFFMKRYMID